MITQMQKNMLVGLFSYTATICVSSKCSNLHRCYQDIFKRVPLGYRLLCIRTVKHIFSSCIIHNPVLYFNSICIFSADAICEFTNTGTCFIGSW